MPCTSCRAWSADEHIAGGVQVKILPEQRRRGRARLSRLEDAVASADSGTPPSEDPTPPAVITGPLGLTLSDL